MQTLTRPYPTQHRPATSPSLTSGIPSPFPREQFLQTQQVKTSIGQGDHQAGPSHAPEPDSTLPMINHGILNDLMPSITYVQKSCIMTLNNVLSMPMRWNPIVPDRRHTIAFASETSQLDIISSTSALQTLVANLRNGVGDGEMVEVHPANNDTELINELRTHVEKLSLDPEDAILVSSLVSLLSDFDHLSRMQLNTSHSIDQSQNIAAWESLGSSDTFGLLKQRLSELNLERLTLQPEILAPGASPVLAVEAILLWHRIDEELENVVAMCKERAEKISKHSQDHLPPQYDFGDYQNEMPPQYDDFGERASIDSTKSRSSYHPTGTASRQTDEKMRLDLENVAMAIERLYLVAPQLHNQRVELKSSKLAQLEKAGREGDQTPQARGKQKERDAQENLFELLEKASERSLHTQSVVLEGGLRISDEVSKRNEAKKKAFVEHLAAHSSAGRLHNQDAILPSITKDPEALLTLPEFMREPLPPESLPRLQDSNTLLTFPEFVREQALHDEIRSDLREANKKKKNRLRSSSAPSLNWLLSPSRSGSTSSTVPPSRPRSRVTSPVPAVRFQANYIAENHENLHHVIVFFTLAGATPGVTPEAEVIPLLPGNEGCDRLVIFSGLRSSFPLLLPARVLPGKHVVKVQSGHYEIKMPSKSSSASPRATDEDLPPLLDAAQLSSANPPTFICASCSLSLVQASKIRDYRDLPSEHWTELVEAWMCHSDQKLHDQIVKHGQQGFWPEPGQGLVGGSYILFEESCITLNNLHAVEEKKHGDDWSLARCLCGAVIGRCQDHPVNNGTKRRVFRLLKFAIRPVSLMTETPKIPLSAFIVGDMVELVQAHATHRFVILDEEEEVPRILVWLFKPSIRIAYNTPVAYSIPRRDSIHAAKVLYRRLTPTERLGDLKTILQRYPGFPRAEYLFYPMPICHRLANLLNESNATYPEGMREMTGLQVGWLQRA